MLTLATVLALVVPGVPVRGQAVDLPSAPSGARVLLWGRATAGLEATVGLVATAGPEVAGGLEAAGGLQAAGVADEARSTRRTGQAAPDEGGRTGCMLRSGILGGVAGAVLGVAVASDGGDSGDAVLGGLLGFALAGAASTGLSTFWCRTALPVG